MANRRRVIALVTDAVAPYHRGGKEQRYLELAHRLAERADVHVYTMKWWDGPRTRVDGGVTYHAISPLLPLYSGRRRSIKQAIVFGVCCLRILGERFDVIEADHMPYLQLFSLKVIAAVRRRPLVITWHECWGPDYWRSYLGVSGQVGWLCERLAMRLPDTIIAASPETARRLRKFAGDKVPIVVAPNGVNLELTGAAQAAADPQGVVVVGRLLPHKRVDRLLDSLAILRDKGRPVKATIIGSGPQLQALTAQMRALGLAELVEFRQDITSERHLYDLLKSARVAVFPSEREGFGIAVLEALACGVPVVTTSAPDNLARHLVTRSAGGGVICEPTAPALAEAIASTLDRSVVGTADNGWLNEYDWVTITDSVAGALS